MISKRRNGSILELAKKRPLVCATILASNKAQYFETAKEAAHLGCDLIEFRVDYLERLDKPEIREIVAESPIPIIGTIRSKKDGGSFPESQEQQRLSLLEYLIDCSPSLIDLELELDAHVRTRLVQRARDVEVGIILSHHDLHSTPSVVHISEIAKSQFESGADIAKLVFTPNDKDEVLRILEAALGLYSTKNLFAIFGMGVMGRYSRPGSLLLGSCLVFCSLGRTDPKLGQIEVREVIPYMEKLDRLGWKRIRTARSGVLSALQENMKSSGGLNYLFDPAHIFES